MRTLEISEETYNKIKDQLKEEEKMDLNDLNDMVGKKWFIRTVTYHLTGRAVALVGSQWLLLEDAAWIASSGRFMQAIKDGELDEVEPVGDAIINLNSVTDMFPWVHDLPMEQK